MSVLPVLLPVLRGLPGVLLLLGIGVLCSADRRRISPRTVLAALALQFVLAALILLVPPGRWVLARAADLVNAVLDYGSAGTAFLFGPLASDRMATLFPGSGGFVFALRVLPQIVYVSALIGLLYHWNIMQRLARAVGGALGRLLGTSRIESFSAVSTIILGQSEMPVAIRPFVPVLTNAELFAVMSSGTASVAGSVLAGYASLGVPLPFLLAASVMAIPGGLLFAKLLLPSTEPTRVPTLDAAFDAPSGEPRAANLFEAVAAGASTGLRVAVAVGVMLLAFIGLLALLDGAVGLVGRLLGHPTLSLELLLGLVFRPVAWAVGVSWHESATVGAVIGQKLVFNEFVAYVRLSPLIHAHALSTHALAIASVALCGFANFSSIGILLATYDAVAPTRRAEVARLGLRAVLAGTLSNLLSATLAGMFIP